MTTTSTAIAQRILEAVLARKLEPGQRLGEQPLALLFDCSRTLVREALMQLATRGIVTVSARRGWYVVEPTPEEAREAFDARQVIERGLIRQHTHLAPQAIAKLKAHVSEERAALAGDDVGTRSYLLGDFHVCLAECLGNRLLANTLRDLTARTTLVAMRYQSLHDAAQSCEDHVHIVAALEAGDMARAEALMAEHIGTISDTLRKPADHDPLAQLRTALQPIPTPPALQPRPRGRAARSQPKPDDDSSYLGALL
ncbi:MAG: HTH-type transcriptional repressor RspR [Paracidovorax wautersii]|uniref:HTH-type transcriptional repressor RspR n=1 Tax=Paracidovorax wautersii TaxID=1177982 RepID=A0A7V8JPS8_9BURK|nr:MAG: HTH-type transcriptional repressor RspR [Paracidovorax wautersii]